LYLIYYHILIYNCTVSSRGIQELDKGLSPWGRFGNLEPCKIAKSNWAVRRDLADEFMVDNFAEKRGQHDNFAGEKQSTIVKWRRLLPE
jgi:hypothetical protein